MSLTERNSKLTLNYLDTTLHEKNLEIITDVLENNSINYTAFGLSIGTEKIISDFEIWHAIFTDIKFKVNDKIAIGDTIVYHLSEQARHVGCFKSIPASGKIINFDATITFRADGEKILGYTLSTNLLSILNQIADKSCNFEEIIRKPIISHIEESTFFKNIQNHFHSIKITLTVQQIKCLSLWFNKRTAKEIGALLHISPRTVETYFEGIKLRLNLPNKNAVFELIEEKKLKYIMKDCTIKIIGEV
ncbi:MAG: ester cyclase [Gammaproteobacteria bacterium]